jgi:lipoate-protein ligase A
MALDEAILKAVSEALSPPTLRLYQWSVPSISIGYFQKLSDINRGYCEEKKYPVVRRTTGGMAILHDTELTYSFSARTDKEPFRGGLMDNYMVLSNALISAMKGLNLDAKLNVVKSRRQRNAMCFKTTSYGEITVNGQKVIGSAQRRYHGSFLQQGTVLMKIDRDELCRVFKGKCSADLRKAFEEEFSMQFISNGPTEFELKLAEQMEKKKYSQDKWNSRR